jgi:ABC-type glycerol-3-phosphate transport system substrate-binding protein
MPSLSVANKRLLVVAAALLAVAALAGCGGGHASISGEVTYNGRPLPSGTITFLGQAGHKRVAAADIHDGKFEIPDLEAGPVKVTVVTLPPDHGGRPPTGQAIAAPAEMPAGKYVPIPYRYASPDFSGLGYDVTPGPQTKVFELTR